MERNMKKMFNNSSIFFHISPILDKNPKNVWGRSQKLPYNGLKQHMEGSRAGKRFEFLFIFDSIPF